MNFSSINFLVALFDSLYREEFKSFLKIILWKTYPREIFNVLLKVFPLSSVFLHWNIFYRFLNFFLVSMANFSAFTFYILFLWIFLFHYEYLCVCFLSSVLYSPPRNLIVFFLPSFFFFSFFLTFHYSTATSNRRENIAWLLCRSKILHNIAPYLSQIPSFSNDFSPMCETCSI